MKYLKSKLQLTELTAPYDPAQERSRKQRAIFTIPYTIGEVHYIMQTVDCVSQID